MRIYKEDILDVSVSLFQSLKEISLEKEHTLF